MKRLYLFIGISLVLSLAGKSQQIVSAANKFISTLNTNQKTETLFPFDSEERYNFHFVPIERKGITFNEMSGEQKQLAIALMKTCLSNNAFQKTQEIMKLDNVLKELENRKPEDHYRDSANYHITIFGIPSATTIWGWRFEGHHISFNFSVNKEKLVAGTPGFLGSNPAIVLAGPKKGKEVLKEESDMGFMLLHSLSPEQLQKALIDTAAPKDILTFDKRKALIDTPAGILYTELNPVQQQQFLLLIKLYIQRYTKLFAEDRLKDIQKAGLENLRFAWAGHTEKEIGKGTYYRVQGPTIIIEYDNTQNNANHVHSVVRDLQHDFGGDELLEHYQAYHSSNK
jgi:hypothetical protein